jgi:hypothetical protein
MRDDAKRSEGVAERQVTHPCAGPLVTSHPLAQPSAPREGLPAQMAHMASVPLDEATKAVRGE